jgi:curved DNA-binding protein CbpA
MMRERPRDETAEKQGENRRVSSMSAQHGDSQPDLYAILGVGRDATREQVIQAWRRRARAEHPDSRPDDAAAPARFRALAEAYQVLADPARRAAYDRASGYQPSRRESAPRPAPGAPLRAGPVRVEPLPQDRADFPSDHLDTFF